MWEIDILLQITAFLKAVVLGAIFCVFADLVRSFEGVLGLNLFFTLVVDGVASLICAVVTFCFFIATTLGEIRFYVILGVVIGFIILRKTLSYYLCNIIIKFLNFVIQCLRILSDFSQKNLKKLFTIFKSMKKVRFFSKKRLLFKKRLEN